jgi:hypothetical protein
MYMHTGFVGLLAAVHLVLSISSVPAQPARNDVEMISGDVWHSDAERIYMPREAFEWHGISRDDVEAAVGDVWSASKKQTASPQSQEDDRSRGQAAR